MEIRTGWHRCRQGSISRGRSKQWRKDRPENRFSRQQQSHFTLNLPTCPVGMEACRGSHLLGRIQFSGFGSFPVGRDANPALAKSFKDFTNKFASCCYMSSFPGLFKHAQSILSQNFLDLRI